LKRIFSIVIATLLIIGIVSFVALDKTDAKPKEGTKKKDAEERVIPYPKGYDLSTDIKYIIFFLSCKQKP